MLSSLQRPELWLELALSFPAHPVCSDVVGCLRRCDAIALGFLCATFKCFQVAFLLGNQTLNECSAVRLPFIIAHSDFSAHCSRAPDFDDEFVDDSVGSSQKGQVASRYTGL